MNMWVYYTVYLQFYTTLTLPTIAHLHQLYGIGVGGGISV